MDTNPLRHQHIFALSFIALWAIPCAPVWSEATDSSLPVSSASRELNEPAGLGIEGQSFEPETSDHPPPRHRPNIDMDRIASERQDYKELVREEAEASTPQLSDNVNRTASMPGQQSMPRPAVNGADRIDSIKSAVRDALSTLPSDRIKGTDTEALQPSVALSPDSRRKRLRELVEATPRPDEPAEDDYLRELHKEVSMTLVTQEAESSNQVSGAQIMEEAETGNNTYLVQPGDSLWKIAERIFGDGYRWEAIYHANRDELKDADMLKVGQRLILPQR
ncbi:LysM peptidoglycan-binding domain-containing protein [Halochromatium glycolicum]|jgi:nucleoid-associated protein YgaU|nr:LysM peptidoglycan-binding domain-containing protein [Halochromatium glycolicum]